MATDQITFHSSRISRRRLVQIVGGASVGAAVVSTSSASARQATTLTWWDYYQSGANQAAIKKQLAAYSASTGVQINRTEFAFADLKQRLLQGATAGQLPDIAVIDNPDHQSFAALGVLADLTDKVSAWGQQASFFKGPFDSVQWQGKIYGLPDNSNCLVLWTNTKLMQDAGAQAPANWDQLKATASTLTKPGKYGLAVSAIKSEEGTFQWLPFLWETGADIPTLDSDGGKAALQLYVDMVKDGSMSRGILGWDQSDVLGQFQNGLATMMINGPWQIPVLKEQNPDLQWQVSVLPQQSQSASVLGGENVAISASSKNQDAAWALLSWRAQPENLRQYLVDAGKLPSRSDLAQDPYWTGDPTLKIFIDQLAVAKPRAYGSKYPQISAAIQDAIQGAVSGQSSVADALKKAQGLITPLLPTS